MYNIFKIIFNLFNIGLIILFVASIKNKNKWFCNLYISLDIFGSISYFICYLLLLFMETEMDDYIILLYLSVPFIVILNILSLSINIFKKIKLKQKNNLTSKERKKYIISAILINLIPYILILVSYIYELSVINNSDVIAAFDTDYNGGTTFAYAISDKTCKQFDLGASELRYNSVFLGNFVIHKDYTLMKIEETDADSITVNSKNNEYRLEKVDSKTYVYKNEKKLCEINYSITEGFIYSIDE